MELDDIWEKWTERSDVVEEYAAERAEFDGWVAADLVDLEDVDKFPTFDQWLRLPEQEREFDHWLDDLGKP